MVEIGMKVKHFLHGEGVVQNISPDGKHMSVKYKSQKSGGKSYIRTHSTAGLKRKTKASR